VAIQPFRIVDKEKFQVLLKYQRPATKDSDIPHRTKLREEIMLKANEAIERLKKHFKVSLLLLVSLLWLTEWLQTILGKISITFDAWTSKSYDPYLAITAHYIDSQKGDPYEWQLKSKILGFEELLGRHSGENMATTISNVLDTYDMVNNYSASNAMANSFAIVAWMGYCW